MKSLNSFVLESRVTGHELLNIFVQALDSSKNGIDVADEESESTELSVQLLSSDRHLQQSVPSSSSQIIPVLLQLQAECQGSRHLLQLFSVESDQTYSTLP